MRPLPETMKGESMRLTPGAPPLSTLAMCLFLALAAVPIGCATRGAGATVMQNQNGVGIQLFTTQEGLNLKVAPEGVRLSIK